MSPEPDSALEGATSHVYDRVGDRGLRLQIFPVRKSFPLTWSAAIRSVDPLPLGQLLIWGIAAGAIEDGVKLRPGRRGDLLIDFRPSVLGPVRFGPTDFVRTLLDFARLPQIYDLGHQ